MAKAVVRLYIDGDFSQVVEIATNLLASDRKNAEAAIRSASREDRFRISVADVEGRIVGLLVLELTGWYRHLANIHWLAVRYECWRKGYGTALIKELEHYAKENNIVRVDVATNPDNKIAVPFYVKNGFEPRGILRNWGKDGGDCLILAKDLPSNMPKNHILYRAPGGI